MSINWKTRVKHPAFWIGMAGVVMSPILAYNGMEYSDLTTWQTVGDLAVGFVKNPYLIGATGMAALGALGVATDPTTKGVSDSNQALSYEKPRDYVAELAAYHVASQLEERIGGTDE